MRIRLYSDLHVEFGECVVREGDADVIVLAGDIDVGERGVDWILRQRFSCPVVYVLGNHEYYRQTHPGILHSIRKRAADANIFVLENESVDIGGIVFHGATLWTDFALMGDARLAGFTCQRVVNDFELIQVEAPRGKLRAADVARLHRETVAWLSRSLRESAGQTNIVVTHHAPSIHSVPGRYRGNIVTSSFASNLESFILEHKPACWLHGHLHTSSDYQIGSCRILCNPKGYRKAVNPTFDPGLVIDV